MLFYSSGGSRESKKTILILMVGWESHQNCTVIVQKNYLYHEQSVRFYNCKQMSKILDFVFEPLEKSIARCGCYVKSQEILILHPNKSVLVPLVSSQYDVAIHNTVANVTLRQTYQNPTDKFLELEYSFPVNPNACIYKFVATFGRKRIQGRIKQKQEAKAEYEAAIKEGKKAAYGELNADSKDILNLKIGNIEPKQSVEIEIVYLQELTLSYNTFYELHMPGTISPRYMNHIPNAVIQKSFANSEQKVKGEFYWNFKLTVKTKQAIRFFKSKSHQLTTLSLNEDKTQLLLAMDNECLPNKDFTFTYTTQNYELPTSVYGENDIGSTAIISFIPKFCSLNVDDAYKEALKGSSFENDLDSARGEYIFLLDRSGSMGGSRIQKATEALALFIKSLPQDTFFNVVSFGSHSESLFPSSVKYNDKEVQLSIKKIKIMQADMGGTEVYEPLKDLLRSNPIEGYPKQIFLLTDGGVSNTEGVIKMVGNNTKFARVHTIGIGNGCSQQLILGCAKSGKGHHVFITDSENPSQKIIQLLTDSLSPVISKMRLVYDKEIVESIVPNPDSLPYILKNEIANFCINFKGRLEKPTKIALQYEDSHNKLPYKSDIQIDPKGQSVPAVDKMSRFKRIRLLEDSFKNDSNIEELMYYVKIVDKKKEIIKQSVDSQILSEFTAFICVESELVDGKYQEIANTGQTKVHIENIRPKQYQQQQQQLGYKMYGTSSLQTSLKSSNFRSITQSIMAPMMAQQMMMPPPMAMKMKLSSPIIEKTMMKEATRSIAPINFSSKNMQKSQTNEKSIFDSVKSFFGFGKNQQMNIEKQIITKRSDAQDQSDLNEYKLDCLMDLKASKKELPTQLKMQKNVKGLEQKPSPSPSISIGDLVALQTTQGCWRDLSLLSKLFSFQVEQRVLKEANKIIVLTFLIARWIERHHPDAMYKLIVKKGLNYVKKEGNLQLIEGGYLDATQ